MAPWLAYLLVFIGVTGHASSEFFAVLSGVSGPEASVWRYMLGAAGLLLICAIWPKQRDLVTPFAENWRTLIPLSIVGISVTYLFFHWALDFATVVQVGTLVTTIPIFVGLSNLIINRAPITAPKIISGLAAIIGVALLLTDGYIAELADRNSSLTGIFLTLGCAFMGSIYAVMVKPYIQKYGAIRITTISLTIGAVFLWIIVGAAFSIWVNPAELFDKPAYTAAALLTLGFWNTTLTQLFWFGGLAAVPDITRGSYLFFLKPVITAGLALLFLNQPITSWQLLAIVVICSSVLVELAWPYLTRRTRQA